MIAPTFEWDPKKAASCWWRSSTIRVRSDLSALGRRPGTNAISMKKTRRKRGDTQDELRPEYDFDYSKAKPNPYAARLSGAAVTVVLDPDVAAVPRDGSASAAPPEDGAISQTRETGALTTWRKFT